MGQKSFKLLLISLPNIDGFYRFIFLVTILTKSGCCVLCWTEITKKRVIFTRETKLCIRLQLNDTEPSAYYFNTGVSLYDELLSVKIQTSLEWPDFLCP